MSLVLILLMIVLFIVVATAHFKLNPFLTLLCAAFIAAFAYGLPLRDIESTIRGGFGNIMGNIGLVIVLGTLIGVILERSGAAITMARSIISLLGERFPLLTMSLVGYMVAIPVFCDSGFVILNSLKRSLACSLKTSPVAMSVALSTGLFATHTLVPPTPGPIAAAGNLGMGGNLGLVMVAGLVFALLLLPAGHRLQRLGECTESGIKIAAPILLVTGAGGAFGAVLAATPLGDYLGSSLSALGLGVLVPFLVAAALKSAQGSSTVAMVAGSALIAPLLPQLGLDSDTGRVLCVMAIGAGAMTVSHVNDSYFWVVSQFSRMDVATAVRTHTMTTLMMGLVTISAVWLSSLVLL